MNDKFVDRLKEMIEKEKIEKTPKERFQALVDRGAIDKDGKVLLKSPWTHDDFGNEIKDK